MFNNTGGTLGNIQAPFFDVIAQGGGGGGGGGGAFFGQAGGNGGQGQFGLPGDGNGSDGMGVGAGAGGRGGPVSEGCVAHNAPRSPPAAPAGTEARGGGGGLCSTAGASGGPGGGGGGGGGAGGSDIESTTGAPNISLAGAPGDGSVTLDYVLGPTAPRITSASALSVMSSTGTVSFAVTGTGYGTPSFSLSGAPSWLSIDPGTGMLSGAIPAGSSGHSRSPSVRQTGRRRMPPSRSP